MVKKNSVLTFLLYFFLLSVFWSLPDINVGLENCISIFRNLISACVFLWIIKHSDTKIRFLVPIILFSCFLFIFHTILLHFEVHPFFESTIDFGRLRGRTITGENLNSNQGAFQIFSLVLILFKLNEEKVFYEMSIVQKIISTTLGFSAFVAIDALGSRTILISLASFCLFFFRFRSWRQFVLLIIFGLVVLFLFKIFGLAVGLSETTSARFIDVSKTELDTDAEMSRAMIYFYSWIVLQENFLFGVGTGMLPEVMGVSSLLGEKMLTHNAFLDLILEFGISSLILIFIIFREVINCFRERWVNGFLFLFGIIVPNMSHNFMLMPIFGFLYISLDQTFKNTDNDKIKF